MHGDGVFSTGFFSAFHGFSMIGLLFWALVCIGIAGFLLFLLRR